MIKYKVIFFTHVGLPRPCHSLIVFKFFCPNFTLWVVWPCFLHTMQRLEHRLVGEDAGSATTDGIQTGMLSPVNRCLLPSLRRATQSPLFYFSIWTGSYVADCFVFFFQRKRKTVTHGFDLSAHSLTCPFLRRAKSKLLFIYYI